MLARERVWCTIGSLVGRAGGTLGSLATLGGGMISSLGGGSLANTIRCGVTIAGSGHCGRSTDAGGGGGNQAGKGLAPTLGVQTTGVGGSSGAATLGQPSARPRLFPTGRRPRRRHNSKRSLRLVKALSWEMVVGGGVSVSASATACKPWAILSSANGAGMVRYACLNLIMLEMTWLLVSILTSLKQW